MEQTVLTVSPTRLETMVCLRKYYWKYEKKLVSRHENIHLAFGRALHAGVAAFYSKVGESFEERRAAAIILALQTLEDSGTVVTTKKNPDTLLQTMDRYCEVYATDTTEYDPRFFEVEQTIQMPNGTLLKGIIDRVEKFEPGQPVTVHDTKTSGWPLTDFFWKNWKNSFQLTTYMYICREILGRCDNVVVDGVHVPQSANWQNGFQRHVEFRTDQQFDDWYDTYCRKTDHLLKAAEIEDPEERKRFFTCEQTQCSAYGGCPYLDVCIYGSSHPGILVDFQVGPSVTWEE